MSSEHLGDRFEEGKMEKRSDPEKPIDQHYALNFSGYDGSKWHIFPSLHPLSWSLCGKKKVKDQSMNTLQKQIGETENRLDEAPGVGTYCGHCLKSAKGKQVRLARA